MNLSISAWNYLCSYSDGASLPRAINEVKTDGFGVELWLGWKPDLQAFERGRWDGLKELTVGSPGLSMHTALFGEKEYNFNDLITEIDLGIYLGAKILVVHPDTLDIAEAKKNEGSYNRIRGVVKYANNAGITLALENMEHGTMELLRQVVDSCGIKVCLDVGHANCDLKNPPIVFLDEFATEIVHFHFADNGGSSDQHLVPGTGNINWYRILARLKELDFSGQCVLELNTDNARQSAFQAREYLLNSWKTVNVS